MSDLSEEIKELSKELETHAMDLERFGVSQSGTPKSIALFAKLQMLLAEQADETAGKNLRAAQLSV